MIKWIFNTIIIVLGLFLVILSISGCGLTTKSCLDKCKDQEAKCNLKQTPNTKHRYLSSEEAYMEECMKIRQECCRKCY